MIEDLVALSITLTKKKYKEELKSKIETAVENIILDAIMDNESNVNTDRENIRQMYINKLLDDDVIEVKIPTSKEDDKFHSFTVDFSAKNNPKDVFKSIAIVPIGNGNQKQAEKKKMKVKDARQVLLDTESSKMVDEQDIIKDAIKDVEDNGIVFIDEIDKIATDGSSRSSDASSGGVQRDLLPLIEGSTVSTKYGNVKTDFILFIASGAFHSVKPSDLLAELQGRLPIRVTLKGLTENGFYRVLTEPTNNLLKQQTEMLKTEKVNVTFTDSAIREIARVTYESNNSIENIGARRLHSVIEKIIEQISYEAPDISEKKAASDDNSNYEIDSDYVLKMVDDFKKKTDLKKYVL